MKLVYCLFFVLPFSLSAQTATLRGQVTDESGAVVPGAKIVLAGSAGVGKTTAGSIDGVSSFGDLPPGAYIMQASAPSLVLRQPAKISLKAGVQTLNLL